MTEREMARKKAAARKARKERERKARNRRVVMTVALMLVVCIASIGGTIAWLTDSTEEVKNVFTPSNIDVEIAETKNDFKMVPGSTIDKDPKVTITNDVDAYLFVEVTESTDPDFDQYNSWFAAGGWTLLKDEDRDSDGDKDYYVYYREVSKDAELKNFSVLKDDQVSVLTTVTKQMMDAITDVTAADGTTTVKDKPTLSFKAYAIQKDNVTADTDKSVYETAWNLLSGN